MQPGARGRLVAAAAAIASLAIACQSEPRTFTPDEVKAAFADAGVPLDTVVEAPPGNPLTVGGELMSGNLGSSFFVSVCADRRYAREYYEMLTSQATSSSFDRLSRNVLISGDDLTETERIKVSDALERLR